MAKKQPTKKQPSSKTWTRRLFVPQFGFVNVGETVTKEAEEAWKAWTPTKIDDFVK